MYVVAVTWPHYQFAEFPWPEELKQQNQEAVTPPAPAVQQYIEVGANMSATMLAMAMACTECKIQQADACMAVHSSKLRFAAMGTLAVLPSGRSYTQTINSKARVF